MVFEVVVPEVDELEAGDAFEVAAGNARRKAETVASGRPDELVLGADTVVSLSGVLYGKPGDRAEARETLRALSGREHTVVSGLCLTSGTRRSEVTVATSVVFRTLGSELTDWYLDSGEWSGRAGGYAIQGRGAALIASIAGDYWNVVGLPVAALLDLVPGLLRNGGSG